MHRTEGANNVNNLFVDGPPGTTFEKNSANALQEEIANAIVAAGITLKSAATDTTHTQLTEAIQALSDTQIASADLRRKNAIINPQFNHAQRGASGSASFAAAADDTYYLDQWIVLSDGAGVIDIAQDTEIPTAAALSGALLSCKMTVNTNSKKFGIFQPIEQKNAQRLIGQTCSLSFKAKSSSADLDNVRAMVVSWDGAADTITSDIVDVWGAEDTNPTLVANWTAENTATDLDVTTSWAQYEIPNISINTASTKNIGVFIWSDVVDAGLAGKILYITDTQLELGSTVTDFEYIDVGQDLARCQRYYEKSYDQDIAPGTNTSVGRFQYRIGSTVNNTSHVGNIEPKIEKMNNPTITFYTTGGVSGQVSAGVAIGGHIGTHNFSIQNNSGGNFADGSSITGHYIAEAVL